MSGGSTKEQARIEVIEMEQLDILRHAVESLERMGVPYFVVGSMASIAYGETRFTQDIDILAAFEMRHVAARHG